MKNINEYRFSRLVLVIFTICEKLAKGFKIHGIELTKNLFQRRINAGILTAAVGVIFLGLCLTPQSFAAETSVLGDQDYADGTVIGSNSTWNAAQAGEPAPFDAIHVAPKTIVFTHSGLDTGREGILTFSLWDLDAEFSGNQVSAFSLDGIPQAIDAFEISGTDLSVREFKFLIDPSFLSDGELVVSISFAGPPAGNEVGIDFSRLDVPPTPLCAPPPGDILGWWSGENNGTPEIGNYVAVPGGGAQYGAGRVGQAFQFDGIDDYVDIGTFGVLPAYTVALWFNADIVDRNRTFISQDRAGYNDDFMLGIEPEGDFYGSDFKRITVVFHDNATQSRAKIRDTVDAIPGRWYFVAVTYDGATMRLWVDGAEKGSVAMSGLATSDQQWNLGQNSHYFPYGSYRNYAGRIDEPLVAGRAFTQSEINGIYLAGRTGICKTVTPPETNIDPQAYPGTYRIYNTDSNTLIGAFSGAQALNLPAGHYLFDNGTQVGASAFNFSVGQFGQVSNVSNSNAAEAVGNTLRLKNAIISIDPQAYAGRYLFGGTAYTGARNFTVVPGLRYGVDNGTGRGDALRRSYFYFDVGASGAISNIDLPAAATGSGSALVFNNTTLIVEPNDYTGGYNISSYYTAAPFVSGRQSFVLIPGLLYAFDNNSGFFEPTFNLNASGEINYLDPHGFASGLRNVLSLANVRVDVDPTAYGGNYRLNERVFSGVRNLVLIPNMRFGVSVNNATAYFTPTQTAVTPPSVTLNDGGNDHTFNFFLSETCPLQLPGLISQWRGEGNALDSVGANHGALQGGAGYTTGKVGRGFRFQDFFNDWVRVDAQVYRMPGGTVSTWFNWDGNAPENWFSGSVLLGSWQGGNSSSPTVWIKFGTLWWDFSDSIAYGAASDTQIPIVPGRWYHVSVTYDENYRVKLYLNGVLVASRNAANPGDFRDEFGIGRGPGVTAVGFSGAMDETQVYDRPLSDCEVRNLYNSANGAPCEICDAVAPVTSAAQNPATNPAGWNNGDVTVSLAAADETGGSGVKQIIYSASGAQTVPATTVTGASANLTVTAEGVSVISYYASDNAGNTETAKTLTVKIDKTAPVINCDAADGAWHAADVSIACTASETISALADGANANFTLTTSVPAGTETSNASTNSRSVCDVAGNCATAGAVGGNKVDKKAPSITIASPTAANYLLNQTVTVDFECTDGGSGVAGCTGTSADGSLLDTASTGAKNFTVNSADNVGNLASPSSVNYTVGFGIQVLFDQTKAHKAGSTVPIKIRLIDANGANVSSAGRIVHAVSVVQTGSQASTVLEDAGNADPDFDFRYDAQLAGYVFNLQTKGYTTGTYQLNFIAGGGAVIYSVQFQIRQ